MKRPSMTAFLALAASLTLVAGAAHATEDEYNVTDGTWIGTARADRGPLRPVTLELRGPAFTVLDVDRVTLGHFVLTRFGPGGKDGRSTFKGTWAIDGGLLRTGKPFRVSRGDAPVALTVWPDGRAVFCHPLSSYNPKRDGEVKVPPGAAQPSNNVRCLDLTRASGPTNAASPDAAEIPPVPSRPWENSAVPTCVEACVTANQMRAVTIDAIRADCEVQCVPNPPPRGPVAPRRAP